MTAAKHTPGPEYGTDHIFGWTVGAYDNTCTSGMIRPAEVERVYGEKGCNVYVLMRRDSQTVVNNPWLKTRRRVVRASEWARAAIAKAVPR